VWGSRGLKISCAIDPIRASAKIRVSMRPSNVGITGLGSSGQRGGNGLLKAVTIREITLGGHRFRR
jgi:hypothetical protein